MMMMNGLRRALLSAMRPPVGRRAVAAGALRRGGPFVQAAEEAPGRGLCYAAATPRGARRRRRSPSGEEPGGACGPALASLSQHEEPEEPLVFPEYLPEEPLDAAEQEAALRQRLLREREEQLRQDEERERLRKEQQQRRRRQQQQQRRQQEDAARGAQAEPSVPSSGVMCSGCGAELHCRDPTVPGFLPSEKFLSLAAGRRDPSGGGGGGGRPGEGKPDGAAPSLDFKGLEGAVCQRCWHLVHYQKALTVQMPREEYRNVVSAALRGPLRHGRPPLVLCMVDLLDLPDSLLPDLPELIGTQAHLFVLGNKVDLLPGDSPRYLKRLREQLLDSCAQAGLMDSRQPMGYQRHPSRLTSDQEPMIEVHLISAKTGYGVETLISTLQSSWKFNGDVYLVGATNTGKSTLFNTLLESDYCKSRASDAINRATISPWPGTTLNLLKFPIINPTPYRIFRRKERLKEDAEKAEEDLSEAERKHLRGLKKQGYLIGRIGRTFKQPATLENREIDFDPELLAFDGEKEPLVQSKPVANKIELSHNEVKDARWFYDTPGIVKDGCILNLLNEKEIKLVLPTQAIVPRTFVLKPQMTLFLGALGRIDYLQGDHSTWFSVVASNLLPVHITTTEKADALYQNHAGQILLKVPMGGEERMKDFPPLVPQDVMLEGISVDEAVADIKFSSAGWVAITAPSNTKIHLRCYSPEGTVLRVRKPPLLPYIVHIKGNRIKRSAAYKTRRPPPFVENLKSHVKHGRENGKKESKRQNMIDM